MHEEYLVNIKAKSDSYEDDVLDWVFPNGRVL